MPGKRIQSGKIEEKKVDLDEKERPILLIPGGYPKDRNEKSWRRDDEEIFEIR